jgi:hypothetical protein
VTFPFTIASPMIVLARPETAESRSHAVINETYRRAADDKKPLTVGQVVHLGGVPSRSAVEKWFG